MTKPELSRIRLWLFDLDGTLYLGDRLFDFTAELLRAIRATGGQYRYLTNNSSRSVADYVRKMHRLGIPAQAEDFLTSAQATCRYLHRAHEGKRLYVCGTRSLKDELRADGFTVTEAADEAECIVMGYDTELTYQKLWDVCRLLTQRPNVPYVATNPDLVCPTEFGFVPDCGGVCGMIRAATGRAPKVIGKPEPLMPLMAMERAGVTPEQTAVVGDRIYTDVKCGLNAGCAAVLVMSGETTPEILAAAADRPDVVLPSAAELLDILK